MESLVSQIRSQIDPLFEEVISTLDAADNPLPLAFFTLLRIDLGNAADEGDVLNVFFELSSTAFQGFVFSTTEAERVDALIAACERISHAMTAEDGRAH